MSRVMLVPVRIYQDSMRSAYELEEWLGDRGVDVVWAPEPDSKIQPDLEGVDLVVSLGGDGTLLRAAHLVGDRGLDIPVLGLSYGHLGFLTCEVGEDELTDVVGRALAGELRVSRRCMLEAVMRGVDPQGREVVRRGLALNEVVMSRGASGKIVEMAVRVNGGLVTELRGDGIVVSTATGSTGYALSAGGPIVTPEYRGLVCVPLAAHTLAARAFLTMPADIVEVQVLDGRSLDRCVFLDGEDMGHGLVPLELTVSRAEHDVDLLRMGPDESSAFYESVSRVFYGKTR